MEPKNPSARGTHGWVLGTAGDVDSYKGHEVIGIENNPFSDKQGVTAVEPFSVGSHLTSTMKSVPALQIEKQIITICSQSSLDVSSRDRG